MFSGTSNLKTCFLSLALSMLAGQASSMILITHDEAQQPKAEKRTRAGLTRGPTIQLAAPSSGGPMGSPVRIVILLSAHGGTKVATNSIKLTYLSMPSIDLTERIMPYINGDNIVIPDAEMPPGKHPMLIEVKDSKGRPGSEYIMLEVR